MSRSKRIFGSERTARFLCLMLTGGLLLLPTGLPAGSLAPSAGPDDSGSAMYTLEDIYDRLDAGTQGSKRSGAFTDPTSVGATMHTLDQIMGVAPPYGQNIGTRAVTDDVCAGQDYWSLRAADWGSASGTRDCTPPVITESCSTTATVDSEYSCSFTVTGAVTIGTSELPAWLAFEEGTPRLIGTPLDGDEGGVSVTLLAVDGNGQAAASVVDITVEAAPPPP